MLKWIVRITSGLIGIVGILAIVYGLAKVAEAESKPIPVEIDLPGVQAVSPTDTARQNLGFRSLAVGVVCVIAAGAGGVYSMRKSNDSA
ncbi:MAG: hypothetical protein EBV06_05580 [Planctomycetia bacterium]|nr:hypothetical protein [Planctomycetia bacterium]